MLLWTAFIFGLLGSFHCVGMCGPIVLSLPSGQSTRSAYLISRVVYNLGRVVTYSLMGLVIGYIGESISLAGYQNILSISMGVLILIMVLIPTGIFTKLFPSQTFFKLSTKIKSVWAKLFKNSTIASLFLIGILNGFLPCGFVYLALAGAAATGSMVNGWLYMIMFGLGTAPILIAVSLAGKVISGRTKHIFNKLIPVAGVVLALLIIIRGLSLGIPYISPKITVESSGEPKVECCHPVENK